MLADIESRRAAFALTGEAALWDRELEDLPDPKAVWSSYAGRCDRPESISADVYADLQRARAWMSLRLDVVAAACPRGFAPFAESLRAVLVAALGGD